MAILPQPFITGLTLGGALIIAIGAQNLFVLRQGLLGRHVWAVVLPCILVDLSLMGIGTGGLALTLAGQPNLARGLTLVGAGVLLVYGALAFRRCARSEAMSADAASRQVSAGRLFGGTLAISLLNPHVYLDTVLLVGTVGAHQPAGERWLFLLGCGSASCLWFTGLGYGAAALAPAFSRPLTWRALDLVTGITMCWIALHLVFDPINPC